MQCDEILFEGAFTFKCTVVFKKHFFNFDTSSIIYTVCAVLDPVGTKMLRLLKIQNLPNKIAVVLHAGSFLERSFIQCILSH